MPLGKNPLMLIINIVLWAVAFYFGFRGFTLKRPQTKDQAMWLRISAFISGDLPPILLCGIMLGYNYYPTIGDPKSFNPMQIFIMISLFVMGINIKKEDWQRLVRAPKPIVFGVAVKWILMPLAAFGIGYFAFEVLGVAAGMKPETAGLMTIACTMLGTTPTGAASNTLTLIGRGDLTLSVSVTAINNVLTPFLMPTILYLLLSKSLGDQGLKLPTGQIFSDLITTVLIPVVVGSVIGMIFPKQVEKIKPITAPIAVICLCGLMMSSMARGAAAMLKQLIVVPFVFIASVIYGFVAMVVGYFLPRLPFLKLTEAQCRALTFENMIENASLAQTILALHFAQNPIMLIMPLVYGKWQQVMSAVIILPMYQRIDDRLAEKHLTAAEVTAQHDPRHEHDNKDSHGV